eukprot:gene48447-biopygen101680
MSIAVETKRRLRGPSHMLLWISVRAFRHWAMEAPPRVRHDWLAAMPPRPPLPPLMPSGMRCGGCIHARRELAKSDLHNAFNEADRENMLEETYNNAQEMYAYMEWCYGQSAYLYFEGTIIESCQGGVQGDPKMPPAFATAFLPLMRAARAAGDRALAGALIDVLLAFLDDANFAGDARAVVPAMITMARDGPPRGFHLSWHKCELAFPAGPAAHIAEALQPLWDALPTSNVTLTRIEGLPLGGTFSEDLRLLQVAPGSPLAHAGALRVEGHTLIQVDG